jgi:hypothetical protein
MNTSTGTEGRSSRASPAGSSADVPNPGASITSVSRERSGPPPLNDPVCQRSSPIHQRLA